MSIDVKCFGSNALASLQPAFYWLSKHIRFVLGVEGIMFFKNDTVTYKMFVDVKCFGSNGLALLQPAFYWFSKHIRFILGVDGITRMKQSHTKCL